MFQIFSDLTDYPINSILEQIGEQWKKVRALSSPTFSAKRMKQVFTQQCSFVFTQVCSEAHFHPLNEPSPLYQKIPKQK